jgi:hypothetical protein
MRLGFALAALAALPAAALAVPMQLAHQGRVLDAAGGAFQGEHEVAFTLYDADEGGAVLHQEALSLDLQDGRYAVILGEDPGNPLDTGAFDGATRYLGLSVDGGPELRPRVAVVSVPYAIRAGTADAVRGGVADVSEVRVNGETVIDGDGNVVGRLVGDADTLRDLGCDPGELVVRGGSTWLCQLPAEAAGPKAPTNPLNHDRFTAAEAVAAMGPAGASNPLNHDRFTAAEAVAAMGTKANTNPLHHDRPSQLACTTVSGAGSAGTCWGASYIYCPSGTVMTGGGIAQSNESLEQSRPCTDGEGQCFVCDNVGGCGRGTCYVRCCAF